MGIHRITNLASTPRRRWFGVGLLGLVGVGALAFAFASERNPKAELAGEPTARSTQSDPGVSRWRPRSTHELAPCQFELGARMAYTVKTRTSVELDMDEVAQGVDLGQPGPGQQLQVSTSKQTLRDLERDWLLELEAVAVEDDGASVLAARIQDQGLRSLAPHAVGDTPSPSAGLLETFLIRVDPRCGIHEFGWRTEGDLEAAHEQQIMVAGLGFWAPRSLSDSVSYGATSFDMTGSYQASYAYEAGGQLRGEVVSYAVPRTDVAVLASTIEVELAAGQWFGSLTNERDLALSFAGVEFGTHFRSTRAGQTALGEFAPTVNLNDGGWSWGRAQAPAASEADEFDAALAELPLEDALARYRELVATGSVSQYGPLMRDWLRANPEQTTRLVAELRAGGFDGDQKGRGGIFYALGSANTAQAHASLVDLVGSSSSRVRDQISAAQALSMVDQPSVEMLDTLRDAALRQDLHSIERGSLALAVGSFARSSADHDPELAAAARAEIATWLDEPGQLDDPTELRHSLLAAGNAGHDELAPSIANYIDHEDAGVRRSATHAMRHMSPEQAYPQLERSLLDEDRVVRTSALETATEVTRTHERRPSEALTELAIDSLDSEFPAERGAAIKLLGEAAKRGDVAAGQRLRDRLRGELEAGDSKAVAALASNMSGHWTPTKQ